MLLHFLTTTEVLYLLERILSLSQDMRRTFEYCVHVYCIIYQKCSQTDNIFNSIAKITQFGWKLSIKYCNWKFRTEIGNGLSIKQKCRK